VPQLRVEGAPVSVVAKPRPTESEKLAQIQRHIREVKTRRFGEVNIIIRDGEIAEVQSTVKERF